MIQNYRPFGAHPVIADFRQFVPAADHPKVAGLSDLDAHAYAARALQNPWIR
jgi:hypothetical protein